MAISRVHTWSAGEVLLASDLNSEYNNILNNAADLVSPFTKAISLGGFAINFDAANTIAFTATTNGIALTGGTVREPTEDTLTAFATGGQTNATALSVAKKYHRISTCATAADSVKLPTSTAGQAHYIRNDGAASSQVYGTSPDTVNSVATGTGVPLPAGTGSWFVCTTAGNWTSTALGAIQLSVLTTKGDVLVGTGSAAVARLGVGANGQSLIADSAQFSTNGIGWGVPVLRSYLSGLVLSTAGGSATMTISAGQAADSTNVAMMTLASAIGKTTSAWAVGTGNGGIDTGAIANSTWYHFFEIMRLDTGVVDVLFSLSASAPTMPASYTLKRRIGSGKTNGSAQWTLFIQDGDLFQWDVPVADIAANNPGTAAVSRTLTVPTGVNVLANFAGTLQQVSPTVIPAALFSDLAITDAAPTFNSLMDLSQLNNIAAANMYGSGVFTIRTNTSAQIRSRLSTSDGNTQLNITTKGWIDRRGRDS